MSAQMIARLCVSGTHLLVSLHKGSEDLCYDRCIHHTSLYYVHALNNVFNVAIGESHLDQVACKFLSHPPAPKLTEGGVGPSLPRDDDHVVRWAA